MATFTKGDIVLIPFPYTDLSNVKIRPCLVISEEMSDDIILCQITSKKVKKDKFSVPLRKDETKLLTSSLIRCNMLFTADKHNIIKKLDRIKKEKYYDVFATISRIIN